VFLKISFRKVYIYLEKNEDFPKCFYNKVAAFWKWSIENWFKGFKHVPFWKVIQWCCCIWYGLVLL